MGRRYLRIVDSLGWTIAGVCDANPEARRAAAREHALDAALVHEDAGAAIASGRPDCAIVATTAPSHCRYTCLAAEARVGRILCEKPMAVSLEECDRMITACARHDVRLAVDHQMRFMPQYRVPKQLAESEALGGLRSVTVVAGNLGLAMNGTHYFEAFRYLTDEWPAEVTAWFSSERVPNPRGAEFGDRAGAVRVVTPTGRRLYLEAGADQGQGLQAIYGCRIGQIVVDEYTGHTCVTQRTPEDRGLPMTRFFTEPVRQTREVGPFELMGPTTRVLEALAGGGGYPSGEAGRTAVATLVAAYVSAEGGHRSVPVGPGLPAARRFPWA